MGKEVGILDFATTHNRQTGSTTIRVDNLLPYWPEAEKFKHGHKYDATIFQKVYWKPYAKIYEGIKILDICDPDWLTGIEIREFADLMDGITCPTEALAEFLRQFGKPVKVIPDRYNFDLLKHSKRHTGKAKSIVWFGYKQNLQALKHAIPAIIELGLKYTIISDEYATLRDSVTYDQRGDVEKLENWVKFDLATYTEEIVMHDIAVLPDGMRPIDKYKSNNKTVLAWALGLPVAKTKEDLIHFLDPGNRQDEADNRLKEVRENYDSQLSVKEMKEFIEELKKIKEARK